MRAIIAAVLLLAQSITVSPGVPSGNAPGTSATTAGWHLDGRCGVVLTSPGTEGSPYVGPFGRWTACTNYETTTASGTVVVTTATAFTSWPLSISSTTAAGVAVGSAVGLVGGSGTSGSPVWSFEPFELRIRFFLGATWATGYRAWVAFSNSTFLSTDTNGHKPPLGAAVPTTASWQYVGVGCDLAVNGGRWVLASAAGLASGNTETGVDTGVSCTAGTWYSIDFFCAPGASAIGSTVANCQGAINGSPFAVTSTSLPASGPNAALQFRAFVENQVVGQPQDRVADYYLLVP